MQTYLEKFESLGKELDKHSKFQIEIGAAIETYAETTDYFKKQHFVWNKKTSELCILRDISQKEMSMIRRGDE